MKPIIAILSLSMIIASCRGGENKADTGPADIKEDTAANTNTPGPAVPNDTDAARNQSGQARSIDLKKAEPNEILAKIDEHLVTSSMYRSVNGGITDCIVTVNNTLADVTFQKAMVEVTIRKEDGSLLKTDYYTVINIEPGMSKQIKIPNNSQGSNLLTNVIKVKSTELTKGEWILTGKQFVAN